MPDASVVCADVSFSWPDDVEVFDGLSFTFGTGRTALVGSNGAGKTTLLRLIAGELKPSSGSIVLDGALAYLPQDLSFGRELTVAEVLDVAARLAALDAIASGDASEQNFAVIGNDWDIEERTQAQLDRLGLGDVALDRGLETLSGGQVTFLGIAAQLLKQPEVLLLDEPSNNLDLAARGKLYDLVADWKGALLVVSHDRALLDRMDRIAELDGSTITIYGGNFSDYLAEVDNEQEAAERSVRNAKQQLKRERREMQQARERSARRASAGVRTARSGSIPKMAAGTLKRRAQESAGRSDDVHGQRVTGARARLDQAERSLREDQHIVIDLPDTRVPAGRTVFAGQGIKLALDGRDLYRGTGLDLSIRGPERVALVGPNGAGKSSLIRIMTGELMPGAGTITRIDGAIAHLSQRLDLLDPDRSAADNLADVAPSMPPADRMNLLARFLLRGDHAQLPVGLLSGGERLRASLACMLSAEPAPQLLLLDEPTNNLDLVSVEQLRSALSGYGGALLVVSHDLHFLREIGVQRWLRLADGELTDTVDPGDD